MSLKREHFHVLTRATRNMDSIIDVTISISFDPVGYFFSFSCVDEMSSLLFEGDDV